MQDGYSAEIKGNKLNWIDIPPKEIIDKESISVKIIIDTEILSSGNGKKMASALEQIAKLGGIKSIEDAAAWQRKIRKDRNIGR